MTDETNTTPRSGADILAQIKPVLRVESTHLCLRPDLIEEHARLEQELNEIEVATHDEDGKRTGRLAGGTASRARELAKQITDLEEQIEATRVEFTFRAMPHHQWQALCDKNPPRENNQVDAFYGFNQEAVYSEAIRLSLIDPVFDDDSWKQFVDVCNPTEWRELRDMVQLVNRSVSDAPKSPLASQVLARRGSAQKQPKPGE